MVQAMAKIKPSQDIRPLSDFRANAAAVVKQVQETQRPVILTQHGRGAAVLLDLARYEELLEEIELLRDVRQAEADVAAGKGVAHGKARAAVLKRLRA